MKITQLEKVHFIKMIELKLTQAELFSLFILRVKLLMYPNCFVSPIQQKMKAFYSILTSHFKFQIL